LETVGKGDIFRGGRGEDKSYRLKRRKKKIPTLTYSFPEGEKKTKVGPEGREGKRVFSIPFLGKEGGGGGKPPQKEKEKEENPSLGGGKPYRWNIRVSIFLGKKKKSLPRGEGGKPRHQSCGRVKGGNFPVRRRLTPRTVRDEFEREKERKKKVALLLGKEKNCIPLLGKQEMFLGKREGNPHRGSRFLSSKKKRIAKKGGEKKKGPSSICHERIFLSG